MNWKKIYWWTLWTLITATFLGAALWFAQQGHAWPAAITLAVTGVVGGLLAKVIKSDANGLRRTLGKLSMTASIAFVGMLALAVVAPNFVRCRCTSDQNKCINNLRLIDGAKQQWALEYHKTSDDLPTEQDLYQYVCRDGEKMPKCPRGGKYVIRIVSATPTCSHPDHVLP